MEKGLPLALYLLVSYPTTSIPIDRAVPATVRIAPSMSLTLRSGILIFAISLTCSEVTEPTFVM